MSRRTLLAVLLMLWFAGAQAAVAPIHIGYVGDGRSDSGRQSYMPFADLVQRFFQSETLNFDVEVLPSYKRLQERIGSGTIEVAVLVHGVNVLSSQQRAAYDIYPQYVAKLHSYYYALPSSHVSTDVKRILQDYRLGMIDMPKRAAVSFLGAEPRNLTFFAEHRSLVNALLRGRVDVLVAPAGVLPEVAEDVPDAVRLVQVAPAFNVHVVLAISEGLDHDKRRRLLEWLDTRLQQWPEHGPLPVIVE